MFVLSFSLSVGLQPSPEGSWQENTQLKELCNQFNFFFNVSLELPGCLRSQCSNLALSGHRLPSAAVSLDLIHKIVLCNIFPLLGGPHSAHGHAARGGFAGDSLLGLAEGGRLQINPAKPPELRVQCCLKQRISSCLSGLALTLDHHCMREGP